MKLAVGADHAGVEAKDRLVASLRAEGHEVEDLGTRTKDSVDYPVFAEAVARRVASGGSERGILVCGSGIGMSMAANKVRGVRAAVVSDAESARLSRRHNDANVLCLGARLSSVEGLEAIVRAWLETPFEGGRHAGRVAQIDRILPALILACCAWLGAAHADADTPEAEEGPQAARLEYVKRRQALDSKDAPAHLALAHWCRDKGLRREAKELYQQALWLAPDNVEALEAGGYVHQGDVWLSPDDVHRLRGDRLYEGRWLDPAAYRKTWTEDHLQAVRRARDAAALDAARRDLLSSPEDLDAGPLVKALLFKSRDVQLVVIEALGVARQVAGVEPLIGLLCGKEGGDLEASVQKALQAMKIPGTVVPLLQTLVQKKDDEIRCRLIRVTGELKDPKSSQILTAFAIFGTNGYMRRDASRALAKLELAEIFEVLCTLAVQGDSLQRARASEALAEYGKDAAIPFLITALELRCQEVAGALSHRAPLPMSIPGGTMGDGGFTDEEAFAMLGLKGQEVPKATFDQIYPEQAALERLTKQSFGSDARRWRAWWKEMQKE